jgi:hypothetical protein
MSNGLYKKHLHKGCGCCNQVEEETPAILRKNYCVTKIKVGNRVVKTTSGGVSRSSVCL